MSDTEIDENDIVFSTEFGEMLKLRSNGDILVKGRLATNDMEVVDMLREFLKIATTEYTDERPT